MTLWGKIWLCLIDFRIFSAFFQSALTKKVSSEFKELQKRLAISTIEIKSFSPRLSGTRRRNSFGRSERIVVKVGDYIR